MILTNKNLTPAEVELDFGKIFQIVLGEKGRGRRELRLTCPEGCKLEKGLNAEYTIGMTKSGRPRIIAGRDNTLYLLISTEGRYTRRGDGWVGVWKQNTCSYEVMARGNGADGDAGRIGQWVVLLVKVVGDPENEWLRIRTGGGGYGIDPQWLNISRRGVFLFADTQKAVDFADYTEVEFPTIPEDVRPTEIFNEL